MTNLTQLKKRLQGHGINVDLDLIDRAYAYAYLKHKGQKRRSGEPYISHPLAVALILADIGMDSATIAAAFLHDVLEDTGTTKEELVVEFGDEVASLVDGVSHLTNFDFSHLPSDDIQEAKYQAMIESLRKFFLAMAKDMRVVIIKLADRLHNMRTLEYMTEADRKRKARETIEVFAPLADRMGMGRIKAELEDLSFKYINPREYERIQKLVDKGENNRKHYLTKIKKMVANELKTANISAEIDGRAKHLYSIYRKLQKVNGDLSKIYDILAIRIIVNEVSDCYAVLGIVHKNFKPLIYRIKDYISVPKPNGYQSLHTTVFGIGGVVTEFQVRTKTMHEQAELGIAAHWHYDETKAKLAYKKKSSTANGNKLEWVNQLMDWENTLAEGANGKELTEALNIDFFNDRIFVMSPKGDVYDLPSDATPVDFAYEIHSKLGDRCRGAKVNGKMVPIDAELHDRDIVEIIPGPKNDKLGPSRGWLEFVRTTKAKQHIRGWYRRLNRDDNIISGKELLSKELLLFGIGKFEAMEPKLCNIIGHDSWKSIEDVYAAIGDGTVTARSIARKLVGDHLYRSLDNQQISRKVISRQSLVPTKKTNLDGVLIRYGECCKPKRGDAILGFITRGNGITIHRADCRSLLTSPKERIIEVDIEVDNVLFIDIEIVAENRIGLLRDIAQILASNEIDIDHHKNVKTDNNENIVNMTLAMTNPNYLTDALPKLARLSSIISVVQK